MNKKQIGTALLVGSLVLGMSTGVMAKGPAKTPAAVSNPVVQEDGRNTNGIGTAQITFAPISGYYGTSQEVSGEVVIDGARDDLANLYITVGGEKADSVWAVPGQPKTYGFTATVELDSHALTNVEVKAETKFHNGQKAGLTHSNNGSTVDVEVLAVITEYGVDFGSEDNRPNFVWNAETNTYSLTFTVVKKLSDGKTETEAVTLDGLIPGSPLNYSSDELSDENYFGDVVTLIHGLKVLDAPASEEVSLPVANSLKADWNGNNQNNTVRVEYIITINGKTISGHENFNDQTVDSKIVVKDGYSFIVNYLAPQTEKK